MINRLVVTLIELRISELKELQVKHIRENVDGFNHPSCTQAILELELLLCKIKTITEKLGTTDINPVGGK